MRMQINLPLTLMEQLAALAREDHRDARRQAEFYVSRAIATAIHARTVAIGNTHDDREVADVSAQQS